MDSLIDLQIFYKYKKSVSGLFKEWSQSYVIVSVCAELYFRLCTGRHFSTGDCDHYLGDQEKQSRKQTGRKTPLYSLQNHILAVL